MAKHALRSLNPTGIKPQLYKYNNIYFSSSHFLFTINKIGSSTTISPIYTVLLYKEISRTLPARARPPEP